MYNIDNYNNNIKNILLTTNDNIYKEYLETLVNATDYILLNNYSNIGNIIIVNNIDDILTIENYELYNILLNMLNMLYNNLNSNLGLINSINLYMVNTVFNNLIKHIKGVLYYVNKYIIEYYKNVLNNIEDIKHKPHDIYYNYFVSNNIYNIIADTKNPEDIDKIYNILSVTLHNWVIAHIDNIIMDNV